MDKSIAFTKDQEQTEVPSFQDLSDLQLALVGGGIGETIL